MKDQPITSVCERINSIVIVADAFRGELFKENTREQIEAFVASWREERCREERARLMWGEKLAGESTWIPYILNKAWGYQQEGFPQNLVNFDGPHGLRFSSMQLHRDALMIVGKQVIDWLIEGKSQPLKYLSEVAAGKSLAPDPGSLWKHAILERFLELCESSSCAKIPTKSELRGAIMDMPLQGGLDDRRYRTYCKALGLAGLPQKKGGRPKGGH